MSRDTAESLVQKIEEMIDEKVRVAIAESQQDSGDSHCYHYDSRKIKEEMVELLAQ